MAQPFSFYVTICIGEQKRLQSKLKLNYNY